MALPALPTGVFLQQGNGNVLVSWNYASGATSYIVQRSTDGINFTTVATVSANQYLDSPALLGVQYYYQVASSNTSGTSVYVTPDPNSVVPLTAGKLSLGAIRLMAQQRADRVNSQFVTTPEWNTFINQSAFELYDLLTDCYEDYNVFGPITFQTTNGVYQYPIPDGILTFQNAAGAQVVCPPLYKLYGVDLGLNNAPNGFVTVKKFNFIDRNKYVFPNTASTIYGVFNLQYRLLDNYIEFIPIPSSGQPIRLWYYPRMKQLLQDSDPLDGVSGWTQYVIVRAAKYALDKEESDTTKLDAELLFLKTRIEESAMNRDIGQADTISDTRVASAWSGYHGGSGGYGGYGW